MSYDEKSHTECKFKKGDLEFIREIQRCVDNGYDGMGLRDAKIRRARRLEKWGYLRFAGYGAVDDADYDPDREYPIFELTSLARGMLTDGY